MRTLCRASGRQASNAYRRRDRPCVARGQAVRGAGTGRAWCRDRPCVARGQAVRGAGTGRAWCTACPCVAETGGGGAELDVACASGVLSRNAIPLAEIEHPGAWRPAPGAWGLGPGAWGLAHSGFRRRNPSGGSVRHIEHSNPCDGSASVSTRPPLPILLPP